VHKNKSVKHYNTSILSNMDETFEKTCYDEAEKCIDKEGLF
jgi:hypothetical protein